MKHLTVSENTTFLNTQRAARPNSPHFTIYQPQITWLASIANRVTGVGLSVGVFQCSLGDLFLSFLPSRADLLPSLSTFPLLTLCSHVRRRHYLPLPSLFLSPRLGPPGRVLRSFVPLALLPALSSYRAHLSPAVFFPLDDFSELPTWFKSTAKFVFAWPFVFHCFNGVRHLLWDLGYCESPRRFLPPSLFYPLSLDDDSAMMLTPFLLVVFVCPSCSPRCQGGHLGRMGRCWIELPHLGSHGCVPLDI